MKKFLFVCVFTCLSLGLQAQGKFFGGVGQGYACAQTRDTLACRATVGQASLSGCERLTVNGQTFSSSGIYLQNLTNVFGCDSALTLILTIQDVDSTVGVLGQTMTALGSGTYQWVNCDSAWMPIVGANQQTFTPQQSGAYAVVVTQNGCSDTSDCGFIFVVGTEPEKSMHGYHISPQPVGSFLGLDVPADRQIQSLDLLDAVGRQVCTWAPQTGARMRLPMQGTRGIYFLRVVEEGGSTILLRVISQ